MTTAFQIGAFQFDAFQEEGVGSGGSSFRPLSGWGLRYWLELRAAAARRRQREEEQRQLAERLALEEAERLAREAGDAITAAAAPRTLLKLTARLAVDSELEEFGALMLKIAAEVEDFEC